MSPSASLKVGQDGCGYVRRAIEGDKLAHQAKYDAHFTCQAGKPVIARSCVRVCLGVLLFECVLVLRARDVNTKCSGDLTICTALEKHTPSALGSAMGNCTIRSATDQAGSCIREEEKARERGAVGIER